MGFTTYDGTPETLPKPGTECAVDGWDYVGEYNPKGAFGPQWINRRYGRFVPVEKGDQWIAMPTQPEKS